MAIVWFIAILTTISIASIWADLIQKEKKDEEDNSF